jgi:hypothetical protein
MGASHGDFIKYPRTPHLFGSKGTADDKHLDEKRSQALIADPSLIVEEKLDGTNVGMHFNEAGELVLQCRGHLITEGMHPQYDLFKQWANVKRNVLEDRLADRYIMFGEWMYARHSIWYRQLSHYFYEFDIYDKKARAFLGLEKRLEILNDSGIETVPVVHRGEATQKELLALIDKSAFGSEFVHPSTNVVDHVMEGVYLRTEADGVVTSRAKLVRPEFTEKIKQSSHWQYEVMVPNELAQDVDIWQ